MIINKKDINLELEQQDKDHLIQVSALLKNINDEMEVDNLLVIDGNISTKEQVASYIQLISSLINAQVMKIKVNTKK